MQALLLAAFLWFFPVSIIWEQICTQALPVMSDSLLKDMKPVVALTFDDGPDSRYTEILLDGLKERNVKATFFVIGENVEKGDNREIIQRMHLEGHLIGNHTFHHKNLAEISGQCAEKELTYTDELVSEITGEDLWLVRPPYGELPDTMPDDDYIYVKWTLDSRDWELKNKNLIVENVVTEVKENDIILMHDCYKTSVESALEIVDILKEKGYDFVTVDSLLTG